MENANYLDNIIDKYGIIGDTVLWELYLQVNLTKYCDYNQDAFDEIYYSLFIDDIEVLKTLNLSLEENEEDIEYCKILYNELLSIAKYNYPIASFMDDIQKSEWIKIINDSQIINEQPINITIYNFYKDKYGNSN